MTSQEIVESYLNRRFRIVTWPAIGDTKGPHEKGWERNPYSLTDYTEGKRVGLMTGTEVNPGQFLHDIDIDWPEGLEIALHLIPDTNFVFGRASKPVSHCFYLLPEPLVSFKYCDVGENGKIGSLGKTLLEIRGTKTDGSLGFQTMAPPSMWSSGEQRELLVFKIMGDLGFYEVGPFRQRVCLAAIGMILAKNFGVNGFGHEAQLAWSGFLLRLGISAEDIIKMGESICGICNHTKISTIRQTVEYTAARLEHETQRIPGGPALAKILGKKGRAIIARINEWLGRDSDFIRAKDGLIVKDSQENIRRAVDLLEVEVSRQEFSERLYIKEDQRLRPLEDYERNSLWLRIDREMRFRPTFVFFEKVIENIAFENSFHPVRNYLDALVWDKTPRIDRWLEQYGGAEDSAYLRAVSALVLLAAVRRIRQPGCKFDEMLVLESQQGLNKSTTLRTLCVRDEWFSDDLPLNVDSKQIIERTLGKWIIEASDLAGKRKAESEQLKSMLSRQIDGPARMAYARSPVERPRQFIIIGTTNSASYLTDSTGSRRFWPVQVRNFDVGGIARDRDQLWAEASVREAAGASVRLPEELWIIASEHQESRRETDAWEETITERLKVIQPASNGRRQVTVTHLWDLLQIDISRRDRVGAMRISEIMQRLDYIRQTVRDDDGKVVRGYVSRNLSKLPMADT